MEQDDCTIHSLNSDCLAKIFSFVDPKSRCDVQIPLKQ
jgi:hypothetical protein